MNYDGEEEYKAEAQADEFVSGDEEVSAEGELVLMSEECPSETAARFWLSVAAYERAPWTTHRDRHPSQAHGGAEPVESDELM